jgi:hypothetical protein
MHALLFSAELVVGGFEFGREPQGVRVGRHDLLDDQSAADPEQHAGAIDTSDDELAARFRGVPECQDFSRHLDAACARRPRLSSGAPSEDQVRGLTS